MLCASTRAQLTALVVNPATLVQGNMEATRVGRATAVAGPDPADPPGPAPSGLPAERVVTAVRRDADVTADRSVFFTSDRVAVRATCRIGFGFPHAAALVRIRPRRELIDQLARRQRHRGPPPETRRAHAGTMASG